MALTKEQREALEGISPEDLASLVGVTHRAETILRVNPEDERKYGDVSIAKRQTNGYIRTKTGVWETDLPSVAAQAQVAFDKLQAEKDEADRKDFESLMEAALAELQE